MYWIEENTDTLTCKIYFTSTTDFIKLETPSDKKIILNKRPKSITKHNSERNMETDYNDRKHTLIVLFNRLQTTQKNEETTGVHYKKQIKIHLYKFIAEV